MLKKGRLASLGFVLSASLILPSCSSGGNPAAPTTTVGGLPAVSNTGGSQRPKVNKLRLTGKVTDVVTGEPIEHATVFVQSYEQPAVQPTVSPPGTGASPSPAVMASPTTLPASPVPGTSPSPGYYTPSSPTPPAATATPGGYGTPRPMATVQVQTAIPTRLAAAPGRSRVAMEEVRETLFGSTPSPAASAAGPAAVKSSVPAQPATPPAAAASPAAKGSPGAASPAPATPIETTATPVPAGGDKTAPLPASGPPGVGPPKTFRTTTNNEGKFWFSGVPEGILAVTVAAAKYRSMTLVNADPDRLSLSLVPNEVNLKRVRVEGLVQSVMGKPVPLAVVNVSYVPGNWAAMGTVSDKDGEFELESVPAGTRTVAAVVNDAAGNVTSFGLVPPVKVDPNEKKPLPVEITLKLVTDPIKLRGTISTPKGFSPRALHIYMTLNDKGEEILVTSVPLDPKYRTFAVNLPVLPGDEASYHVEAVATDHTGAAVYHHALGIREGTADLQVAFIDPPERTTNTVTREDKELIPTFNWSSVPDVSLYRLVLMEGEDRTLWEAWTPYTSVTYPLTFGPERVQSKVEYRWTVTAIKDLVPPPGTTARTPSGKLSYRMLKPGWADAASITAQGVLITKKDLEKLKEEEK